MLKEESSFRFSMPRSPLLKKGWKAIPKKMIVLHLTRGMAEKVLEEWHGNFKKEKSIYVNAIIKRIEKKLQ